jgi:hypothetical protein
LGSTEVHMQSEIVKRQVWRMSDVPRVFGDDVHPWVGASVKLVVMLGWSRNS